MAAKFWLGVAGGEGGGGDAEGGALDGCVSAWVGKGLDGFADSQAHMTYTVYCEACRTNTFWTRRSSTESKGAALRQKESSPVNERFGRPRSPSVSPAVWAIRDTSPLHLGCR